MTSEEKNKEIKSVLRLMPFITSFGGSTFLIWKNEEVIGRILCKKDVGNNWRHLFYIQKPGHTYKVNFEEFLDNLPDDYQDQFLFHLNLFG